MFIVRTSLSAPASRGCNRYEENRERERERGKWWAFCLSVLLSSDHSVVFGQRCSLWGRDIPFGSVLFCWLQGDCGVGIRPFGLTYSVEMCRKKEFGDVYQLLPFNEHAVKEETVELQSLLMKSPRLSAATARPALRHSFHVLHLCLSPARTTVSFHPPSRSSGAWPQHLFEVRGHGGAGLQGPAGTTGASLHLASKQWR